MKALIILLLSASAVAQVSSGGPVAQVESKKIVSPAWETPGPEAPTHRAPLESKPYLALQSAHLAAAAFDSWTTVHNLDRGCREANPLMGSRPSTAHVALFEAGWTAGELLIAHVLRRKGHGRIAALFLGESIVEHGVAGGLNTRQVCF